MGIAYTWPFIPMPTPLWQQVLLVTFFILGASFLVSAWIEWIEKKKNLGEASLGKLFRINLERPMGGWEYFFRLLLFTVAMGLWIFAIGLCQGGLPMNPAAFHGLSLIRALHLAVSTATHTNWQPFAPESNLSPFTQAFAVCPCNFLAGAVGVAAWRALVCALQRKPIGNAWAGIYRGIVLLLPIVILLTGILMSQGVKETFAPRTPAEGPVASFTACSIAVGAGAGWVADNASSALENPTLVSDIALLTALVAIPLGFCLATGVLIGRRGLMLFLAFCVFACLYLFGAFTFSNNTHIHDKPRWNISESLYLNATAGSGNGSQNAAVEAFKPAGRIPPFLILLGGLPFPPAVGAGVGILLMYFLVTLYLAALMSGRSPDFLGFKTRMGLVASTSVGILGPQLVLLMAAGVLVTSPEVISILKANGPYGMSALLWAIGSWTQNNGSAYSLDLSAPIFINASIIVMLLGRVLTLASIVMLAASIAAQKDDPPIPASVDPKGVLTVGFWLCVMWVAAVLAMLPLIMMGPLLEALK